MTECSNGNIAGLIVAGVLAFCTLTPVVVITIKLCIGIWKEEA